MVGIPIVVIVSIVESEDKVGTGVDEVVGFIEGAAVLIWTAVGASVGIGNIVSFVIVALVSIIIKGSDVVSVGAGVGGIIGFIVGVSVSIGAKVGDTVGAFVVGA